MSQSHSAECSCGPSCQCEGECKCQKSHSAQCSCGPSCQCEGECKCQSSANAEGHQIRLTYYNGRGLGEVARLLLAAAQVKYEDVRLDQAAIDELKKSGKLAYNQVPLLEFDGHTIVQSMAIYRFLSRKFGFYGETAFDEALIDQVVEGINDIRSKWMLIRSLPEDKQPDAKAAFERDVLPVWLGYLEKLLQKNNDGKSFFHGNKLSLADVYAFHLMEMLKATFPSALNGFSLLEGLLHRVAEQPGIKHWLAIRPPQ